MLPNRPLPSPNTTCKNIVNARGKNDGAPSDQAALALKMKLPNFKFISKEKRNTTTKETKRINNKLWHEACSIVFKETIVEYIKSWIKLWKNNPLPSPSQGQTNKLESFEQYIVEIAKTLAEEATRHHPDWFTQAEKLIMEHIKEWNKDSKEHMENKSQESKTRMRNARAKLQTAKRRAKCKWQWYFADKCKCESFKTDPKSSWNILFQLIKGFEGHHQTHKSKRFMDKRGRLANMDKMNVNILHDHYQNVFNRAVNIDLTILEEIEQEPESTKPWVNHQAKKK